MFPLSTVETSSAKDLRRLWAYSQRVVASTAQRTNFAEQTRSDEVIGRPKAWAISTWQGEIKL